MLTERVIFVSMDYIRESSNNYEYTCHIELGCTCNTKLEAYIYKDRKNILKTNKEVGMLLPKKS